MKKKRSVPTRREFLRQMATGVGVAAVGSALPAFADHHSHPTPQSLTYLDRNSYESRTVATYESVARFEVATALAESAYGKRV
jgi:predicted amidohydrolase YtcJ